jgi:hypothetical protein
MHLSLFYTSLLMLYISPSCALTLNISHSPYSIHLSLLRTHPLYISLSLCMLTCVADVSVRGGAEYGEQRQHVYAFPLRTHTHTHTHTHPHARTHAHAHTRAHTPIGPTRQAYLFGVVQNTDGQNSLEGPSLAQVFPSALYADLYANLTTAGRNYARYPSCGDANSRLCNG